MFRVLVVDDELIVRVGIKSLLDWSSHGFEIVDVACDGADALKKIELYKPEIVLTDIVMPNMDGIQLLKVIREKYKYMKVIILSCHNEFEYVKEAMKLGAADYILKLSMQPQDLLDVLLRCSSSMKDQDTLEAHDSLSSQANGYLMNLLTSSIDNTDGTPDISAVSGSQFAVFVTTLVDPASDGSSAKFNKKIKISVANLINDVISSSYEHESFFLNARECVTILRFDPEADSEAIRPEIRQMIEHFHLLIRTYLNCNAVTGFCEYSLFTAGRLKEAYTDSSTAAAHGFYLENGGIVNCERLSYTGDYKKHFNYDFIKHTHEKLKSGDIEHVAESITQLFDLFAKKQDVAPDELLKIGKAIINVFQLFFLESVPPEDHEKISNMLSFEQINNIGSLLQLRGFIGKCVEIYKDVFYLMHKGVYFNYIKQMKNYVNQNYMHRISLDHAAAYLNLSKSYFCNIFKIETGETFNDYLTGIRLQNAKRLMQETDLSIKEIAENIGFDNVNYFYTLFKKSAGISPKKYKENLQKAAMNRTLI